ncbi:hypothetical protein [Tranquillimonas alkanivorans]|uniref:Uncharacterized protein n=1 Tax=Tranquillimonas alkanivorans TaxID=441119 RepID=A0A1I5MJ56_9RHOB|nr:hypothetical protein [Tranquillimonas alkanivorans]SFP09615.1 hypothetical protein SAMN04488047_102296 [Tranquillimonas alkanivorans]
MVRSLKPYSRLPLVRAALLAALIAAGFLVAAHGTPTTSLVQAEMTATDS